MFYFIVSGYIPGTDIQISFDMIIFLIASVAVSLGLCILIRNTFRHTRELLVAVQNMRTIEELAL